MHDGSLPLSNDVVSTPDVITLNFNNQPVWRWNVPSAAGDMDSDARVDFYIAFVRFALRASTIGASPIKDGENEVTLTSKNGNRCNTCHVQLTLGPLTFKAMLPSFLFTEQEAIPTGSDRSKQTATRLVAQPLTEDLILSLP